MTRDENRLMKLNTCSEISFSARDVDDDYISVKIEKDNAQLILDFIKQNILKANEPGNNINGLLLK